jgi:short-subunit dehydrogenase
MMETAPRRVRPRTAFVDAKRWDESAASMYRRLADPGRVTSAGLQALDHGPPMAIPALRNRLMYAVGRVVPRRSLTRTTGRVLASPWTVIPKYTIGDARDAV